MYFIGSPPLGAALCTDSGTLSHSNLTDDIKLIRGFTELRQLFTVQLRLRVLGPQNPYTVYLMLRSGNICPDS